LREAVVTLMSGLLDGIRERHLPVGHVKFLVRCGAEQVKISSTSGGQDDWRDQVPPILGKEATVVVNARVEADASALAELAREALSKRGCGLAPVPGTLHGLLPPGFPRPTHRFN
jgi:hypothetical protein